MKKIHKEVATLFTPHIYFEEIQKQIMSIQNI